jgi:exopolysaccharide biosynthesis polyprenyl glycosylphosphotransferase
MRKSVLNEKLLESVTDRYIGLESVVARHRTWLQLNSFLRLIASASTDVDKRLFDLVGAILLLIILSPVFLVIAVLIKLDSGGPVFFKQSRVGKWGKRFVMYKFRSMTWDAERRQGELVDKNEIPGGVIFKMKCDPRVTRVGRLVRRSSLDELPQLWNVLKGEMSLVGPRPPVPVEVASYSLHERRRLEVKPGITCTWQVSGRSQLPFRQQVALDVAYIESQSLWGDIKLLLRTVPAVLVGRGAY